MVAGKDGDRASGIHPVHCSAVTEIYIAAYIDGNEIEEKYGIHVNRRDDPGKIDLSNCSAINDEEVALEINRQTFRSVELRLGCGPAVARRPSLTRSGEDRHGPRRAYASDDMAVAVGQVDVARLVHRDARRKIIRLKISPERGRRSVRVDFVDERCSLVHGKHIPEAVGCERVRRKIIPRRLVVEIGDLSCRINLLDPSEETARNIQIPQTVERYAPLQNKERFEERCIGWLFRKRRDLSVLRDLKDSVFARRRDIQVSVSIHGETANLS